MNPLAISHIAWPKDQEDEYLELISRYAFKGIELAPSILWPEPILPKYEEVKRTKKKFDSFGLTVTGFQALFYNHPEFNLFSCSADEEKTLISYVKNLATLCRDLGGSTLIHGSPLTRKFPVEGLVEDRRPIEILQKIADVAQSASIYYLIEPLSKKEDCDLVNNTREAIDLIEQIDCPYFGLHIDTKTIILEQESIDEILHQHETPIRHVHISTPNLAPIQDYEEVLDPIVAGISQSSYSGYLSIEMRRTTINNLESVEKSLESLRRMVVNPRANQNDKPKKHNRELI